MASCKLASCRERADGLDMGEGVMGLGLCEVAIGEGGVGAGATYVGTTVGLVSRSSSPGVLLVGAPGMGLSADGVPASRADRPGMARPRLDCSCSGDSWRTCCPACGNTLVVVVTTAAVAACAGRNVAIILPGTAYEKLTNGCAGAMTGGAFS